MGWLASRISEVRRIKAKLTPRLSTLYLPGGSSLSYSNEELLDALRATLAREEHPLRSAINETDLDTGLEGLIRALDRSYAQEEE